MKDIRFLGKLEWKDSYKIVNYKDCFKVLDENGNVIYLESSIGFWHKCEFDKDGIKVYYENLLGLVFDHRFESKIYYGKHGKYLEGHKYNNNNNIVDYKN